MIDQKGFYGFVLEFKQGRTVRELLLQDGHQFSDAEIFNIGMQLIKIIRYIHENGVVHGDIRIPNVLVDHGTVYLIDFGLARWADGVQYHYSLDFSYLGDLLLYLLYSSFSQKEKCSTLPWYLELPLSDDQKLFIKRLFGIEPPLFGIEPPYNSIVEIEMDFSIGFRP